MYSSARARKGDHAVMTRPEIGVYLPQMGFSFDDVLHRTRRCEELGIDSLWLYDHLYGPGMPEYPSMEAWTLATALLARTDRIRVGHMVLCNQFRHPVTLAKMATTLDQISGGRLTLGLGSGSIEDEHRRAGLQWGTFAQRSARLGETLQILHQAFTEERIDFTGEHFTVSDMPIKPGAVQHPGRRSWSEASARSSRCRWLPATQMSGMCPPTRLANWNTSCRHFGRSAKTSVAIPTPSCSRSRR